MSLTRIELRRIRPAAAAVAGWLAWGVSVHAAVTRPEVHPAWFVWAVLTVEGAALVWCVHDVASRSRQAYGPTALVISSVALMATTPYALSGTDARLPPLLHVVLAGMVLAPTTLSARGSIAVGALLVASLTLLRQPVLGTLGALVESLQLLVVIVIQLVLWTMLKRAVDATHDATLLRWNAEKEAARAKQQASESERWDALLHDKVLGALQFAVRGRSGPAASLASEALETLAQESPRPAGAPDLRSLADVWARRLGLHVAVDVEGGDEAVDPEIWEVVRSVVTEALVNVARHSGQSIAWIEGHASKDSIHLVIGDPGRGFDTAAPGTRAGLRLSRSRLESVGAGLVTSSRPGRGTRVEITWRRASAAESVPGPWSPDIVRVMFLLGCGVVVLCGVGGLTQPGYSRSDVLAGLAFCAIAALTAWVAAGPRTTRTLLVGTAGLLATASVLSANVAAPYAADWRWWFVGSLNTAIAIVVLRWNFTRGGLLANGLVGAILVGHAVGARGVEWTAPAPILPQMAMTAAVAGIVRRGLERSQRNVQTAQAETGRAEIAAAAAAARSEVYARRAVTIRDAAGGPLELIARTHVPSEAERDAWSRLEQRLRDELVAASILTPTVVAAIELARDRDVGVEIITYGEVGELDPLAFATFCTVLLDSAGTGARVTAIWRPLEDGRLATVVVDGPQNAVEWTVTEGYSVESLVDSDASLYTLRRRDVPNAGDSTDLIGLGAD